MTVLAPFPPRDVCEDQGSHPAASDLLEAMRRELDAMQSIAQALLGLPEGRVRARVLAWAIEMASVGEREAQAPTRPGTASLAPVSSVPSRPMPARGHEEPALSLDGIESLFDDGRPSPGQFPPSPRHRWARKRLSPRLLVRFRWWK